MDYCSYVDLFCGNGEINPPPEDGLASRWIYLKAQSGNTVPHAALPFGKITAGAYSGGYPCGYGTHYPNCCGGVQKLWDKNMAKGFSHIHHSGTGGISYYYNYAVVTPFYGDVSATDTYHELVDEQAQPGWYSARLGDVYCEMTVSDTTAYHHYFFEKSGGRIAVDFANDGLHKTFGKNFYNIPKDVHIELNASGEVLASGMYEGIKLYFCVSVEGENVRATLFEENQMSDANSINPQGEKYGVVYDTDSDSVIVKVSYSTVSYDCALANIRKSTDSFDTVMNKAYSVWNGYLSRIHIETEDEEFRSRFYSYFYHSLIKPVDMTGESILGVKGDVCADFTTLWDMYKTVMPLIMILYPDMGEKIVKSIINMSRTHGKIPCSFGLTENYLICEDQARMLGMYVLCDGYYRNIPSATPEAITECMKRELERDDFREFSEKGLCERYTHIIDMADACDNVAAISEDKEFAKHLVSLADNLSNAFDKDGYLSKKSWYYEGDRYTYSFRLLKNMDKRIEIAGGKERYAAMLDSFFGFDGDKIVQVRDIDGAYEKIDAIMKKYHRFEAFNNESDMEAPYAYIYADRHDRTCDVVSEGVAKSFGSGRGGIPGNNDSGGLSTCFMWNVMGIFPVSGQNLYLLGKPHVDKSVLFMSKGKKLEIIRHGNGKYVDRVTFNGAEVKDYRIAVTEVAKGGMLEFFMN